MIPQFLDELVWLTRTIIDDMVNGNSGFSGAGATGCNVLGEDFSGVNAISEETGVFFGVA